MNAEEFATWVWDFYSWAKSDRYIAWFLLKCFSTAGYLNNPEATAATKDSQGWLHTGDLGHVDTNGLLFIVDRLKEIIKYKANQVAPGELESIMLTHPSILDVAVIP